MQTRLAALAALFAGAILADIAVVRTSTASQAAEVSPASPDAAWASAPPRLTAVPMAAPTAPTASTPSTTATRPDLVATYTAMRDAGAPQWRLQYVEQQARIASPAEAADLLGAAMVDPDETIRARAQALYDQALLRQGSAHP